MMKYTEVPKKASTVSGPAEHKGRHLYSAGDKLQPMRSASSPMKKASPRKVR